jgi:hypothetical protein
MANIDIRGTIVLIDDDDLELVSKHKWWITPQGYACTKIRYAPGRKNRKTIGMHRLILGDPATSAIDHINRNKLDNRKDNLMACSDSQNNRNRPTVEGKFSVHRGVSFRRGKWQVVIRVNGILKWFGSHKTEEEAALIAAPYFADIAP